MRNQTLQNLPMLLKPSQVQSDIGISIKTLRELKDTIFKKGVHYFIPAGLKHPLWSRDALLSWIREDAGDEVELLVDDILHNS